MNENEWLSIEWFQLCQHDQGFNSYDSGMAAIARNLEGDGDGNFEVGVPVEKSLVLVHFVYCLWRISPPFSSFLCFSLLFLSYFIPPQN